MITKAKEKSKLFDPPPPPPDKTFWIRADHWLIDGLNTGLRGVIMCLLSARLYACELLVLIRMDDQRLLLASLHTRTTTGCKHKLYRNMRRHFVDRSSLRMLCNVYRGSFEYPEHMFLLNPLKPKTCTSFLWDIWKQCKPRSDAAFCGV